MPAHRQGAPGIVARVRPMMWIRLLASFGATPTGVAAPAPSSQFMPTRSPAARASWPSVSPHVGHVGVYRAGRAGVPAVAFSRARATNVVSVCPARAACTRTFSLSAPSIRHTSCTFAVGFFAIVVFSWVPQRPRDRGRASRSSSRPRGAATVWASGRPVAPAVASCVMIGAGWTSSAPRVPARPGASGGVTVAQCGSSRANRRLTPAPACAASAAR